MKANDKRGIEREREKQIEKEKEREKEKKRERERDPPSLLKIVLLLLYRAARL